MTLTPADYSSPGPFMATDAEAAALRETSKRLLLGAATQAIAAAVALLAPTDYFYPAFTFALFMGFASADRASDVLWYLAACHGQVDDALVLDYWVLVAAMLMFVVLLFGHFLKIRKN
ncbi:hypothetical protein EJB05_46247 [Eragrostis curvula]|uniref:Uncharacterized protein n=1 Tax=Eragrostis curvula TaxID=38414 RepID=A0A5J9TMF1_9POAL|nr:hypothetical protein EJB05_46247 [Eragrostis curvula]